MCNVNVLYKTLSNVPNVHVFLGFKLRLYKNCSQACSPKILPKAVPCDKSMSKWPQNGLKMASNQNGRHDFDSRPLKCRSV
jgi:hypothetical protein